MKKKITNLSESDSSTNSGKDLRLEAEAKWSERGKETDPLPATEADARRLIHELEVHKIELEMQNEELVQARVVTEAALHQYEDLYVFAPIGYFTLARNGAIRQVNFAGANLLGLERGKLVKQRFGKFVSIESRKTFNTFLENVFSAGGRNESCEVMLQNEESALLWVHIEATAEENWQECNAVVMDISGRKQAEHQANERVKELQTFYNLAEITEREGIILDKLYQEFVDILPKSWQYPEIVCARIVMGDSEFRTENFALSVWMQSVPIKVNGAVAGRIEVGYLEQMPKENEGPFLKEEWLLLNAIAERLGRITERKQYMESLRVSEERFRLLANNIPDIIYSLDDEGNIVTVNNSAFERYGYSEQDSKGKPFLSFIHPEDREIVIESFLKAVEEQRKFTHGLQFRIVAENGISYWFELNSQARFDSHGRYTGEDGVLRNISERKQAEDALQESEEKFKNLVQGMQVGVLLQNSQSEILLSNPKALEFLGLSEDQILGKTSFDPDWNVIHEDGSPFPGHTHPVPQAIATRRSVLNVVMGVYRPTTRDRVWLSVDAEPQLNNDGTVKQVICSFIDITARKHAEERKEFERREKEALINSTKDLIWSVNKDFKLIAGNNSFIESVKGFSGVTLTSGDLVPSREIFSPELITFWKNIYKKVLSGESISQEFYTPATKNLQDSWLELNINPIWSDKEVVGIACFGKNITARKQVEEALRESEIKYRSLIESSSDAIFCVDERGQYKFTNQLFASTFGQTPDYFIGKTFWDVYSKEQADYRFEATTRVFQTGESESLDVEVPLPDKTLFFYATANPIKDETGKVILVLTHAVNITERKQAEEALRLSELDLKEAQTTAHIGNWKWDIKKKEITWSDEMYRIFGIDKNSYSGRLGDVIAKVIHPDDLHLVLPSNAPAFAEKKPIEYRIILTDGSIRHIWAKSGEAVVDNEGNPIFLTGIAQDITGRKQAEEELQKLANVVNYSSELVNLATLDGKMIFLNEAGSKMLGISPAEVEQINIMQIIPTHFKKMVENELLPALLNTGNWIGDLQYMNLKTGQLTDVHATTFVIKDQITGAPLYLANVSLNITERKRAEAERERLRAEVDQKNKELESLVYIASHDMRSPLVTVQGFGGYIQKYCRQISEIMERAETLDELRSTAKPLLEEKIPNALHFIESGSLKMHALVDGLLRLSRVGSVTLQMEDVDMNHMLQNIQDTLAFQAEKFNAQVKVEKPLAECYGDKNQLNQVFSNLLDNAIKYRDAERPLVITISSRVEGQKVIYTIADSGIGISLEDQEKIWILFRRVGSDETIPGEGLGLALVQRIVERHGGKVWVESEIGVGSRFHVELPGKERSNDFSRSDRAD